MKPLDFIGAIELVYDRSKDEHTWLEEVTCLIAPAFTTGPTTTAFFFEVAGANAQVGDAVSIGEAPYSRDHYAKQHELGSELQPTRVAYDCDMFTLLSRVIGADAAASTIREAGMLGDDAVGLRANVTPDSGVIFTTHVSRGHRLRQRNLWTRFAAHVGSALRLRRKHTTVTPTAAEAVLTPAGRLEHGTGATIAAREELARAAQDIDRARGKLRRLDPDSASALWRAMVSGEWSLVDWLDHDGKRFLLAQSNLVAVSDRKPLTEREQQVVACAAMGHSNKLIAYDLGLSPGTVSVILMRAAKKLGVSGRVALIRAFRESQLAKGAPDG